MTLRQSWAPDSLIANEPASAACFGLSMLDAIACHDSMTTAHGAHLGNFGSTAAAISRAALHASSNDALAEAMTSTLDVELTSTAMRQALLEKAFSTNLALLAPIAVSEITEWKTPVTSFNPEDGCTFNPRDTDGGYSALHC
ncbi:hypothetical protein JOF41_005801 [Saccharothrix coeruleofusca]|uniref:hypothetical protein n=1 Tax=Saccharothrix coeruleofusca TaxID=33919 RepID=UPI001AE2A413|nr:hypothetical protein [Saccharothrix coeruleofusca]MBP2339623.1 hypothetical protein [Saccharothrix coeruleofusca]